MTLHRTLEPEAMDTVEETEAYDAMDHRAVNRAFVDDLLRVAPSPGRVLDLGAGIGSVGLMTLWRMSPTAHLTMVEAQDVSHALARRTIAENGLGGRVTPRLGDLRGSESVPERDHFDLVTGSPPYIPLGRGHVSPHPQRAACRMELRGTIADYAATAARAMRPDGWFVVCFAAGDPRAEAGVTSAGLHVRIRQDVVFRPGQAPTIALFACTRTPGEYERRAPLHVRGPDRDWTEDYLRLRVAMGTEIDRARVAGGR